MIDPVPEQSNQAHTELHRVRTELHREKNMALRAIYLRFATDCTNRRWCRLLGRLHLDGGRHQRFLHAKTKTWTAVLRAKRFHGGAEGSTTTSTGITPRAALFGRPDAT